MRFFIEISYRGTNYHGWQVQPNNITIQAVINKALTTILKEEIFVTGAGRTDAGVHANQMYAHFDTTKTFEIDKLIFRLNQFLAKDITIHKIIKVSDDANCRFDAKNRTYRYFIINQKNSFIEDAFLIFKSLDLEKMRESCKFLVGKHDFTSFTKKHSQTHTNFCKVEYADWIFLDNQLIFEIKADRFLWNMVRSIVGTLLQVGEKKIRPSFVKDILAKKDRSLAGKTVPAHALFLYKIEYSNKIINAQK